MSAAPCRIEVDEDRFRALWLDATISIETIATRQGMSSTTVIKRAREFKFPARFTAPFAWTDELEATAKGLYQTVGAPETVARMAVPGLNVSVIAGRAAKRGWRSGLAARKPPPPSKRPDAAGSGPTMKKASKSRRDPVAPKNPKILADHSAGECVFPVGPEPAGGRMDLHLFCCEAAQPGRRYCPAHVRFSTQGNS